MKTTGEITDISTARKEKILGGSELWTAICLELKAGKSPGSVAKKLGVSESQVKRIGVETGLRREFGLSVDEPGLKAAHRAQATYAKEKRIELLDIAFAKVEALLADSESAVELDKLISGLAKLIDKRRLEDGEATSRSESTSGAKDSLEAKLDDLARRRDKKTEAIGAIFGETSAN